MLAVFLTQCSSLVSALRKRVATVTGSVIARRVVLVSSKVRVDVIERGVRVFQHVDQLDMLRNQRLYELAIFTGELLRLGPQLKLFQLFQLMDVQGHCGTSVQGKLLQKAVVENAGRVDSPTLP